MKAIIVILIALIVAIVVTACATTLNPALPKLGLYHYTHAPVYTGEPVRTIPIWIDKDFGEADKIEIDNAINAWNFAMNGYIKLKVVDTNFDMEVDKIVTQVKENGWLFMKIKSDNKLVPAQSTPGFWTIGFCERIGGQHLYLVRDRLTNEDVFGVTLHEIGHLMGSGHVGQRLMYPHYSRARFQCIDYDTMVKVSNYFDLRLDNLNYCSDGEPVEATKPSADGGGTSTCPMDKEHPIVDERFKN